MKPFPVATAPRGKRKPFTIAFFALVVGGFINILGSSISNPEIRWAIGLLFFGTLLIALSIGALCEMMED